MSRSTESAICCASVKCGSRLASCNVEQPSFSKVRADRYTKACGKRRGRELAIYVNTRWCNHGHVSIKISKCYRDTEILAVRLLPYYNPNTGNVGKFLKKIE